MKTFFFCILIHSIAVVSAYPQTLSDTVKKVSDKVDKVELTVKDNQKKVEDSLVVVNKKIDTANLTTLNAFEIVLVLLIPAVFIFFSLIIIVVLKKCNYNLCEALSEVFGPPLPGNTTSEMKKSSSRIVAFFSGVAAIIISIGGVAFFIYRSIKYPNIPPIDFSNLIAFLIPLGIGVAPYAFNKVSDAFRS